MTCDIIGLSGKPGNVDWVNGLTVNGVNGIIRKIINGITGNGIREKA